MKFIRQVLAKLIISFIIINVKFRGLCRLITDSRMQILWTHIIIPHNKV